MDGFRSKSFADNRTQIEVYNGGAGGRDFRSYSYGSGAASYQYQYEYGGYVYGHDHGANTAAAAAAGAKKEKAKKRWALLADPETKRKKRVATYKAYAMEGKMKGSLRRSFKWLKNQYTQVVYGWW